MIDKKVHTQKNVKMILELLMHTAGVEVHIQDQGLQDILEVEVDTSIDNKTCFHTKDMIIISPIYRIKVFKLIYQLEQYSLKNNFILNKIQFRI